MTLQLRVRPVRRLLLPALIPPTLRSAISPTSKGRTISQSPRTSIGPTTATVKPSGSCSSTSRSFPTPKSTCGTSGSLRTGRSLRPKLPSPRNRKLRSGGTLPRSKTPGGASSSEIRRRARKSSPPTLRMRPSRLSGNTRATPRTSPASW